MESIRDVFGVPHTVLRPGTVSSYHIVILYIGV